MAPLTRAIFQLKTIRLPANHNPEILGHTTINVTYEDRARAYFLKGFTKWYTPECRLEWPSFSGPERSKFAKFDLRGHAKWQLIQIRPK